MSKKEPPYTFHGFYIPERMWGSLQRYIHDRVKPGKFLQVVIANDLKRAVFYADEENLANIKAYVGYLCNEAPPGCHGSKEALQKWLSYTDDEEDCDEASS